MTSCAKSDTLYGGGSGWVGTDANNWDKNTGQIAQCPTGYTDSGWTTRKNGWGTTQYNRVCKRTITNNTDDCALGLKDSGCANDYCNADTPGSIKYLKSVLSPGGMIVPGRTAVVAGPGSSTGGGHGSIGGMLGGKILVPIRHTAAEAAKYATESIFGLIGDTWKKARPTEYNEVLELHCQDINNIGKPQCRVFCVNNPGKCNTMNAFCKNNPTDELCTCINADLNVPAGVTIPPAACYDTKCQSTGYRTKAMEQIVTNGCPDFKNIDCRQIITVAGSGSLTNGFIKQNCSMTATQMASESADAAAAKTAKESADAKAAADLEMSKVKSMPEGPAKEAAMTDAIAARDAEKKAKEKALLASAVAEAIPVETDTSKYFMYIMIFIFVIFIGYIANARLFKKGGYSNIDDARG